jgi:cell division protein FtsL
VGQRRGDRAQSKGALGAAARGGAFVKKARPHFLIALVVAVVAAAALVHVWVHLQVIAVGYEISRETRMRHDLTEANQRLALELRTRMDLAVVEKLARERLKMTPPDPRAIRVLHASREDR